MLLHILKYLLFIVLLLSASPVFCQLDNEQFNKTQHHDSTKSYSLYFNIDGLGFFKNNEYFNKIADGYTLFGHQFSPYFTYYPAKNFSVTSGVFFQQDFGNNKLKEIAPILTLTYFNNDFRLNFGTIEGNLNHNLIEPLYDFDALLTDPLENGVQFKWDKKGFKNDIWVDWKKMIYKGDTVQEEIWGGISLYKEMIKVNNFYIGIPFQFTAFHHGGQINMTDKPISTLINAAIGITVEKKIAHSAVSSIKTENYIVFSQEDSKTPTFTFDEGQGYFFNFSTQIKKFTFLTSYWHGNKYTSFTGGQLYQSRSSSFRNADHIEKQRQLLFFRLFYNIKLFNEGFLSVRFEPFYDLKNKKTEFSHGLYLNIDPEFFLLKTKK